MANGPEAARARGGRDHRGRGPSREPHTREPGVSLGDLMLLSSPPRPGEGGRLISRLGAAFPGASHIAIGVDGATARPDALAELVALGLRIDVTAVPPPPRLTPPAREAPDAVLRRLESDSDWRAAIDLNVAADDEPDDSASHREYLERRTAAIRSVCEAGHGAWFGAFRGDEMRSEERRVGKE